MSDKNIDKDIWRCKELIGFVGCELREIEAQSIENVLSELETKIGQTHLLSEEVFCLNKELETYKKIAEKLAVEVEILDDKISAEIGNYTKGYCNIENGCIFNYKRKCSECILDWARKEVEKDVR